MGRLFLARLIGILLPLVVFLSVYRTNQVALGLPVKQSSSRANEVSKRDVPEQVLQELTHLFRQGQHEAALAKAQDALATFESQFGTHGVLVGSVTSIMGLIYKERGEYDRAEPLLQRSLLIFERAAGPNHLLIARTLNDLASLYQAKTDYARAALLYQRALSITERAGGPNAPELAGILNDFGGLHYLKGDYVSAETMMQRALSIDQKAHGPTHEFVARDLNNLADLYRKLGDNTRAEPLYERALMILEKASRWGFLEVVQHNLAQLYSDKGDYSKALSLAQRALTVREKTLAPNHPSVVLSLVTLAQISWAKAFSANADADDIDRAVSLYGRALERAEEAFGPKHPDLASLLSNTALVFASVGNIKVAEPLALRSLEIRETLYGGSHSDVAMSLNALALVNYMNGEYGRAEPLYRRALAIHERVFGGRHPTTADILENFAVSQEATGRTAESIALMERSNDIGEQNLRLALVTGSENQKLQYMNKLLGSTFISISLHAKSAPGNPEAARLALTAVLQRKGRVLDAVTDQLASLRRRLNPEDRLVLDGLSAVRSELARRVLDGAPPADATKYRAEVATLEAEAERLERQVSARSAGFRSQMQPVTLDGVQRMIPAGAALVEIAVYRPVNAKLSSQNTFLDRFGPERYIAYVLRPAGAPSFVDLGEVASIDVAVGALRSALRSPRGTAVSAAARKLDELVMRPVRSLLGETEQLLLSPDGMLNLVPFAALVDEEDRYLIERYKLTYLTSGRDLLRLPEPTSSRQAPVVVANPKFDTAVAETTERSSRGRDRSAPARRQSSALAGRQWTQLPGTAGEAAALEPILRGSQILTGDKATEAALKQVAGPRILHLATHGFFLSNGHQERVKATPGLLLTSPSAGPFENPLLRSGLVLAGANQQQSGANEDGVLTALEAAGLDLWGTKLVVLSACDTGVGDVRNGEGVYGLRRALLLAGAQSAVMSLWQVDDEATRDLMVEYYQRLQAGEGRGEALRQVQLSMLASSKRAAGVETSADVGAKANRSHPFYWASFIPVGNWRNLAEASRE